ncbi:Uncharacterised protein [Chlamydia trachomatis]|nr:Uncharacterised protein [Chlamydia trachomatis]
MQVFQQVAWRNPCTQCNHCIHEGRLVFLICWFAFVETRCINQRSSRKRTERTNRHVQLGNFRIDSLRCVIDKRHVAPKCHNSKRPKLLQRGLRSINIVHAENTSTQFSTHKSLLRRRFITIERLFDAIRCAHIAFARRCTHDGITQMHELLQVAHKRAALFGSFTKSRARINTNTLT